MSLGRLSGAVLALVWGLTGGWADVAAAQPTPREINIAAGSTPGWVPTEAMEEEARRIALAYLAAHDGGHHRDAYAMLDEGFQANVPEAEYKALGEAVNRETGPVRERRITTVNWTAGSVDTPDRGVYVALDLVSRFDRIERHCGYLVLHQPPSGGPFKVLRSEEHYLTNAEAVKMGPEQAEAAWGHTSARCPNYVGKPPLAEAAASTFSYPTVEAALAALRADPGYVIRQQDGWTVASNDAARTFWSFPPVGHPAYPSAVRRRLVNKDGQISLEMSVLCQAEKAPCDELVRSFNRLNAEMNQRLQARAQ